MRGMRATWDQPKKINLIQAPKCSSKNNVYLKPASPTSANLSLASTLHFNPIIKFCVLQNPTLTNRKEILYMTFKLWLGHFWLKKKSPPSNILPEFPSSFHWGKDCRHNHRHHHSHLQICHHEINCHRRSGSVSLLPQFSVWCVAVFFIEVLNDVSISFVHFSHLSSSIFQLQNCQRSLGEALHSVGFPPQRSIFSVALENWATSQSLRSSFVKADRRSDS